VSESLFGNRDEIGDTSGRTNRICVLGRSAGEKTIPMQKLQILILYPDPAGLGLLTSMLKSLGHSIEEATTDRAAVRLIERNNVDLVLAGVDPLDAEALELLMFVRRKHREVPVILLFPRLHPERSKEALKLGAAAVLKYPVPAGELRAAVLQAIEMCEPRSRHATSAGKPAVYASVGEKSSHGMALAAAESGSTASQRNPHSNGVASSSPAASAAVSGSQSAEAPVDPTLARRIDQVAREIGLLGHDPSWLQAIDLASTVAATRSSVLIVGEPGTGKSLLARLIHGLAHRSNRPFVVVEASGLADDLSLRQSAGSSAAAAMNAPDWSNKIAQARGGTLYLHEIGILPLELQHHLLRELQFRDYEATAGRSASSGEVRFLMSTSENLPALIDQGKFRQELYHRINLISLMLPPLRHRGTDIELLADAFRARFSEEFQKSIVGFSRDALDVMQRHDWPGNVRELESAMQRAAALCTGPRITAHHLTPLLSHSGSGRSGGMMLRPHLKMGVRPLKEALEEPEKRIIVQALQAYNWNRQETARVLDINRTTLYKKMKKYNLLIDEPTWAN
jgi:two-component system response regulator HydG